VKPRELLPACFVVFTALLVWPLLSIPNRAVLVAGVPALVLYLFAVWAAIVAVLAWTAWRAGRDDAP
jgi:apolipoprotein N-acyltransferase